MRQKEVKEVKEVGERKVRTTIYVDEDLMINFKKFCIDERKTVSEAIQEAISLYMSMKMNTKS